MTHRDWPSTSWSDNQIRCWALGHGFGIQATTEFIVLKEPEACPALPGEPPYRPVTIRIDWDMKGMPITRMDMHP